MIIIYYDNKKTIIYCTYLSEDCKNYTKAEHKICDYVILTKHYSDDKIS